MLQSQCFMSVTRPVALHNLFLTLWQTCGCMSVTFEMPSLTKWQQFYSSIAFVSLCPRIISAHLFVLEKLGVSHQNKRRFSRRWWVLLQATYRLFSVVWIVSRSYLMLAPPHAKWRSCSCTIFFDYGVENQVTCPQARLYKVTSCTQILVG